MGWIKLTQDGRSSILFWISILLPGPIKVWELLSQSTDFPFLRKALACWNMLVEAVSYHRLLHIGSSRRRSGLNPVSVPIIHTNLHPSLFLIFATDLTTCLFYRSRFSVRGFQSTATEFCLSTSLCPCLCCKIATVGPTVGSTVMTRVGVWRVGCHPIPLTKYLVSYIKSTGVIWRFLGSPSPSDLLLIHYQAAIVHTQTPKSDP